MADLAWQSRKGRTVYFKVGLWYDSGDVSIRISSQDVPGAHFITTVNKNASSKRCHENLYRHLARCLRQMSAPAPEVALTPPSRRS